MLVRDVFTVTKNNSFFPQAENPEHNFSIASLIAKATPA
jgi:hypothetical protein